MTATLTAMREALATNLAVLDGYQISAYMLANPSPPTIHLYPGAITYDLAARRGLDVWTFAVQGFVGDYSDIGSQQRIDPLLAPNGTGSLKQAIEVTDPGGMTSLGGLAGDVSVLTCTGYRRYTRDSGGPVLGAEWTVQVLAAGN